MTLQQKFWLSYIVRVRSDRREWSSELLGAISRRPRRVVLRFVPERARSLSERVRPAQGLLSWQHSIRSIYRVDAAAAFDQESPPTPEAVITMAIPRERTRSGEPLDRKEMSQMRLVAVD